MLDEPTETSTTDSAESSTAQVAAATSRPRRRAAVRPAGPPAPVTEAAAPTAPAPETPPADEPAGATPRKRAAKKAPAKSAASKSASSKSGSSTSASSEPAEPKAAAGTADSDAEQPAPPRARRSRAKAAPLFSADDEAAFPPSAPDSSEASPAEVTPVVLFQPPDPEQAEAPRRRSRTRKAAPATDGDESTAEAAESGPGSGTASGDDESPDADTPEGDSTDDETAEGAPRRRRRRGGRGRRGRGGRDSTENRDDETPAADDEDASAQEAGDEVGDGDDSAGSGSTSSRRRRRRRRGAGSSEDGSSDDPPNTVVRVREPRRSASDEVTGVRGSTRLEAKKQRRREGREQGRRRPPILTESEFLARRESVERVMIVRQTGDRTQIAVLEDNVLVEHYVNKAEATSFVGNVYLGRVQNVLPSMEAAFVDIGKGRNAVLYAGEVNWDVAGLDGQPRRIEHAMKSGDQVLVQVTKDPIGNKGSRLTAQVSLPGRFLVYVPDGSMTGISRKLPDTERTRLKSILKAAVPEGAGVIVRTAAEGATEEELSRDVSRLSAQWDDIAKKAKSASAPALLYGEPDLAVRVIRDVFNEDVKQLIVSGDDAWDMVQPYLAHVAPDLADRLSRWTDDGDVFAAHRIDEQLAKALDRKVWLPSGGSLVIDRTEAMTVVDVNTGKFTGSGGNLEETVTRNNLEAAEEIVRQLRLRDVGGIIVVDFIDMVLESNRDLVLRRLLECLSRDRTKHQVAEVTSLGLVQMTRKRVGQGLIEAFSQPCEHCGGRGVKVQFEPVDLKSPGGSDSDRGRRSRTGKGSPAEVAKASAKAAAAASAASAEGSESTADSEGSGPDEAPKPAKSGRKTAKRSKAAKPKDDAEPVAADSVADAAPEPASEPVA